MVPLLGFAAIRLDVAGMYWERQELQTGADAGALAIAQDCSRGGCVTTAKTAQDLASANLNPNALPPTATVIRPTANSVTVRTTGGAEALFAPVLGVDSTTLSAQATVTWGSPVSGTAKLPLTFSWWEWQAQRRRAALRHYGGGHPVPEEVRHRLHRLLRQLRSGRLRLAGRRPGQLP